MFSGGIIQGVYEMGMHTRQEAACMPTMCEWVRGAEGDRGKCYWIN